MSIREKDELLKAIDALLKDSKTPTSEEVRLSCVHPNC